MATNPIAQVKILLNSGTVPSLNGKERRVSAQTSALKNLLVTAPSVQDGMTPIQAPLATVSLAKTMKSWGIYSYVVSIVQHPVFWAFLIRRIASIWNRSKTAPIDKTAAVSQTQQIQDELSKIPPVLQKFLVLHRLNARLGEAEAKLQSQQLEAEVLRERVEALTPEDVDRALDHLNRRLHAILARNEGNVKVLVAAARNLQKAQQDVAEANARKRETAEILAQSKERLRLLKASQASRLQVVDAVIEKGGKL